MSEIGREINNFSQALPTARLGRALRRRVLRGSGQFDCGLRVMSGSVPGEGTRWKHRRSHVEGDVLHHGPSSVRLALGDQVPHPGGFGLSARVVVWNARALDLDADVQLAFVPADAERVLDSDLARDGKLQLNPHIEDL